MSSFYGPSLFCYFFQKIPLISSMNFVLFLSCKPFRFLYLLFTLGFLLFIFLFELWKFPVTINAISVSPHKFSSLGIRSLSLCSSSFFFCLPFFSFFTCLYQRAFEISLTLSHTFLLVGGFFFFIFLLFLRTIFFFFFVGGGSFFLVVLRWYWRSISLEVSLLRWRGKRLGG